MVRPSKFGGHIGQIEWMKADENVYQEAEKWRWIVKHSWEDRKLDWLVHEIQTDFIDRQLKESKDFEIIQTFFDRAKTEMNPIHLIKAYTAETDFYKHLNKQLAIIGGNFKGTNGECNRCGIKCYLQVLFTHRDFDQMSYVGECYRGMTITKQTSEYPEENEILIMPYTAFRVKLIRMKNSTNQNDQIDYFIDLEESIPQLHLHQKQAIINAKQLTFRNKFKKKFNKWLGNED
ncbi:unnamed protein product [Didymodactylos carnosus]|uniref:Uncharacterized protein n=1 Tax=Didymodactylos carnosus TaxID=1234261 RepID=A0A814WKH7_9BILA|nr:unnamed protein product [Didymodactylos carnosus]CAF1203577.1 unnamed protein product [Didymodactylos carnosus]CAF3967938.1 unnamed protein product [Didymodactylos carnosus]CAF3997690.1 unnamed protein product [Didymodactylos carnosus]